MTRPSYKVTITQRKLPHLRQIVSEELLKGAIRCENQYKQNLQEGKGAQGSHGRPYAGTGEAIASVTMYPQTPGADLYTVEGPLVQHAIAEFGRAPGKKMPPPAPIDRWAREAGLTPREGETWDDMILNLRRHIAAHGLRAFAPMQLAAETIAPTIEPAIRRRIAELNK
ncbi:MAG: hypothetical protein WC129_04890 [Sphaerochaetaceae bacterium]